MPAQQTERHLAVHTTDACHYRGWLLSASDDDCLLLVDDEDGSPIAILWAQIQSIEVMP